MPSTPGNYLKQASSVDYQVIGVQVSSLPKVEHIEPKKYISGLSDLKQRMTVKTARGMPALNTAHSLNSFLDEVSAAGFDGVKLHPRSLDWVPNKELLDDLLAWCVEHRKYFSVCGYLDGKNISRATATIIEHIISIATTQPELRIIVHHADAILLNEIAFPLIKFRNILFDTSFALKRQVTSTYIEQCALLLGSNANIVFGTDWPDYCLADYLPELELLRGELNSTAIYARFLSENAFSFFTES